MPSVVTIFMISFVLFSCSQSVFERDIPLYQSLVFLNIPCSLPPEDISIKIDELRVKHNIPLSYIIDDKKDHYILFHDNYIVLKNYHLCQSSLICPPHSAFRGFNEDLTPICNERPMHSDMIEDVEFCDQGILRGFPRLGTSSLYIGCFERPSQNCQMCSCGKITNKSCSSVCPKGTLFVSKNRESGLANCFEYEKRPEKNQVCEPAILDITYPKIPDPGEFEWPCSDQYPTPPKPLPFIEAQKVFENEEK